MGSQVKTRNRTTEMHKDKTTTRIETTKSPLTDTKRLNKDAEKYQHDTKAPTRAASYKLQIHLFPELHPTHCFCAVQLHVVSKVFLQHYYFTLYTLLTLHQSYRSSSCISTSYMLLWTVLLIELYSCNTSYTLSSFSSYNTLILVIFFRTWRFV